MVTASNGWAQAHPLKAVSAVSLVLRDMGNGVTRVLHAALIEGGVPPPEFFEVFEGCEVPVPLCGKLSDALGSAVLAMGGDAAREYVGGYMRPLTEEITEFLVW